MTGWLGPLIAAITSILVAFGLFLLNRREIANNRRLDARDHARVYREPLLHSAFNLQARLWNIASQDFLGDFLTRGTDREKQYARLNTVYLIAQYLCWAEIVRRAALYLVPRKRAQERALILLMEDVRDIFADSRELTDDTLRIFRGDQRAIGEILILDHQPGGMTCLGYAGFVERISASESFASWLAPVVLGLEHLAEEAPDITNQRIRRLQNSLLEIVSLLDPKGERVDPDQREPLSLDNP